MPLNNAYTSYYEVLGPMGLIVHCTAFVHGPYIFGAMRTLGGSSTQSMSFAVATGVIFELWYALSCGLHSKANTPSSGDVRAVAVAGAVPISTLPPAPVPSLAPKAGSSA